MSMKIIVVAVICMVVLVVLLIIMGGKTKMFTKAAASCVQKGPGAHCISDMGEAEAECDGSIYKFGTDCGAKYEKGEAEGPWCCVPIGG